MWKHIACASISFVQTPQGKNLQVLLKNTIRVEARQKKKKQKYKFKGSCPNTVTCNSE